MTRGLRKIHPELHEGYWRIPMEKLVRIVLDDNPSKKDREWAKTCIQDMIDRLDACDTDSQTSNKKGEV